MSVAQSRYIREIHTHEQRVERSLSNLVKRDQLRRQAQTILYDKSKDFKKQHRAVWCARHSLMEGGGLPVMRNHDGMSARIAKVKTCGSVWACPVCSAKVAELRRAELSEAMLKHTAAGGYAYLLTFTFPHYKGQGLADMMPAFEKARQSFQNSRKWKAVFDVANVDTDKPSGTAQRVGSVNSLEVTYGAQNGWHPHLHMLVFCKANAFEEGAADESGRLTSHAIEVFKTEWVRQLEKRGLVDGQNREWANRYALDVRGGADAAQYVAKWGHDGKWGLSSELTKSHAKTGGRNLWGAADHYTPFDLVAMSQAGDGHATCAFREFALAFEGKRMLTWTRGLKKHFGINEVEDEAAAEEKELELPTEHCVGELSNEQLQVLVKWGQYGEFLSFVARHCAIEQNPQQKIDEWIDKCKYGRERGGDILVDRLVIGDHNVWYQTEVQSA